MERLSFENKTPGQLADDILHLSHDYCTLSDELGIIYQKKDLNWGMLRDTVTSDRQADQLWRETDIGSRERQVELELKKIQKSISAIKTYLHIKENEAKNLY